MAARLKPEGLPSEEGVRIHRVPLAGPVQILRNLVGFARGESSLNECLFYSPRGAAQVQEIARAAGCELVVADMIRTVPLAQATGLPMIVDLDDLLSERYHWLAAQGGDPTTVLGYYSNQLPRFLARPAGWLASRLLGLEARRLDRRELEVARQAAAVSLVAASEANRLEQRAGVPVACLPMALRVPDTPADVRAADPSSIVFTGGLDYLPNEIAIRWFADEVASRMDTPPPFRLTVIGQCPDVLRSRLESPVISFLGYVDDIGVELPRHRAFVAPMVEGTGVKTKVLEAMAAGLPVVTTPAGVRGLSLEHGVHCLIAETGEDFLHCLARLRDDNDLAASIGAAGREYVREFFSPEVIVRRWERLIQGVVEGPHATSMSGRRSVQAGVKVGGGPSSAFETGP